MQQLFPENKLAEECRKGRSSAQDLLYGRYAPTMLGVCLRYVKPRAEAEDILQDSFVKVFVNIGKFEFKGEGSLGRWIKTIVINTALNYLRTKKKQSMFSEMELIADNEAFEPFDDELDENMAIEPEFLMEMIQSLPDGYRTVFNLHIFEKWGHREIAESLGISEGTSKSQLAKARMMLKKRIEELMGAKRKLIMV